MDNFKIYLITLTFICLWVKIFDQKYDGNCLRYKHRLIRHIDFKPINCTLCLSFWIGIALSIWFNDLIFVTLPLITLIKE